MSQAEAPRTIAYCSWHKGLSDTARLIRVNEAATGPGGLLFACAGCRQKHDLTPLGDQP
ncbi:hypothetical protein QBB34_34235 [Streptomyces stelliscabiei]|uniref:hypothetical protein n=1 Tax=Streptomyces stelliscabiei TaxID=146820 RepID=UPI002FF281F7